MKYIVSLMRSEYGNISVDAENEKDACELALELEKDGMANWWLNDKIEILSVDSIEGFGEENDNEVKKMLMEGENNEHI